MRVVGLLVLAGWGLLVAAAWLVALPAGLAVAGVGLLLLAKAVG